MKSMSKQQLASYAGVTVKTLMRWLKPYEKELEQMGMKRNAKVVPPNVVEFILKRFTIIPEP
ncbi:MAG: hypothetical protein IKP48_00830 [Bacteroidaceae bacterium]|jgi:transposase|nr:hypothetical protein [Bacteroidaceae bacterium]